MEENGSQSNQDVGSNQDLPWETQCFGDKQIRICVLNTATNEELTAAGNQLSKPETAPQTGDIMKHSYQNKNRERNHDNIGVLSWPKWHHQVPYQSHNSSCTLLGLTPPSPPSTGIPVLCGEHTGSSWPRKLDDRWWSEEEVGAGLEGWMDWWRLASEGWHGMRNAFGGKIGVSARLQ